MLSSCGFKDIDKRFFVVALGLDMSDNEKKPYRITLQLAVPSPKIEPGASKTQIETIESESISEGVRMLKAYVDKELDFGHCKVFIIGEKLARKDYRDLLQWMMRRRDIQSVADIAIGKPDAESLLKVRPGLGALSGQHAVSQLWRRRDRILLYLRRIIVGLFPARYGGGT